MSKSDSDCDTRRPPNDGATDDLPPCKHCGESFESHQQDGDPAYMCPPECQLGCMYGFFVGGDPRDFTPDFECCTPKEIENHRKACAEADAFEAKRKLECPSRWVAGVNWSAHVTVAPFGIGTQNLSPTYYEPTP